MLDLNEEEEDYLDTYKKNKKKHHDSDDEYILSEDEELYSNKDDDDDISYIMSRTVKKKKPKLINNNKETSQKKKPLRISLKKSLGGNHNRLFSKKKDRPNDLTTPLKNNENKGTKQKLPTSNKIIKEKKMKILKFQMINKYLHEIH